MTAPARTRSVLVEAPGRHRLVSAPTPSPGPGEALVRVAAAGLCGSDREVYDGGRPAPYVRYPLVPGHEWAGTVAAVGDGVPNGLTGRKVVGENFRTCLTCDRCRAGETSLCAAAYDETGFTRPGAFADTLLVPARLLHPLPDAADLDAAALLEPAAVAAAAALAARAVPGERVAVLGAGTLGLLAVRFLAAVSPAELIAVDPRHARAEQALEMGATGTRSPGTGPGGFDVVMETAGAPGTAATAAELTRRGGRLVLVGLPGHGARGLDPVRLVTHHLTVRGVFGAPSAAWTHAVRAFTTGLLDPAPLITHTFALERWGEAVALVGGGDPRVGKVLVRPTP
ncbi:zinc-binding dehydrogenase [Streptomyces rimosus]|uniref:zinc-dependent alcohol dehydrogenase n=1 Tax=Streptomyces rimosus TaxID=1927 RepID=UPI0004CB6029|nr:alcohol dehydrogenase catalytic domain-containing protein [Streptomyces rimosus]